ncbi:MAG: DEAD/DEAH box helicase family protein [Selenomonadaceae bacterium]|nr:DEAD/DEAH box helicase family protein [Selenomonadaceae bacterium]
MKLQFKHQKFQADAAKAVVDVFAGQPHLTSSYMMDQGSGAAQMNLLGSDDFTGVGKTYTYIKTMYELNKQYGWSKFIIVVPSIAIREGVYKSFQVTQEHFAEEYGKKIRFFIYKSSQLTEIDRFASDSSIHVMIINVQAFNARGKDLFCGRNERVNVFPATAAGGGSQNPLCQRAFQGHQRRECGLRCGGQLYDTDGEGHEIGRVRLFTETHPFCLLKLESQ